MNQHGQPRPHEGNPTADPELALMGWDLDAWADQHPCECEAVCECDREDGE